ncbi:uncharacterized protein A4U43_C08F10240 [Asparagus officinalis]|nr:uncharacterized protein A4U43_C08F10240 [Asparagus officinalis]
MEPATSTEEHHSDSSGTSSTSTSTPQVLDLSAPDSPLDAAARRLVLAAQTAATRRHSEDFREPSPSPKPTRPNTQSLKRRGGGVVSVLLPPLPAKDPESGGKGKSKKFREDSENQDPNGDASGPVKAASKAAVKSSARARSMADAGEEEVPRLRSTMSREELLFSGGMFGQISSSVRRSRVLACGGEELCAGRGAERQFYRCRENDGPAKSSNEKFSVLKEVRACPPTPQRIPSPSNRRPRKAGTNPASSPLSKPLKPKERGILKELDQRKEEEKKPLVSKDEECNRATDVGHEGGEGSSMDMFWFFKPCTYLVK